jgi:hypothetical protein
MNLKSKQDIFLDFEHYLSELFKWMQDNSFLLIKCF